MPRPRVRDNTNDKSTCSSKPGTAARQRAESGRRPPETAEAGSNVVDEAQDLPTDRRERALPSGTGVGEELAGGGTVCDDALARRPAHAKQGPCLVCSGLMPPQEKDIQAPSRLLWDMVAEGVAVVRNKVDTVPGQVRRKLVPVAVVKRPVGPKRRAPSCVGNPTKMWNGR